ncbi:restriction endonuclease subunit S [Maribacter sp. M208]|uniref:restriction endonuclease subunit S n=1 Tax=Maribacter huludaoensis TaxID=3030010 RepID=UPI0023EC1D9A|nr:restriction endonuclease subunit S [Maribacter huludaoensis]MDF4221084.1 restriction endonuclease subunit S [Maribacter huludaoensis]
MNYKRLGDYIEPCNEKNIGNKIKLLQGISNRKYFQKAKTNTIGVDLSKYRIVRTGQFAFNRATTRNGDRISIALRFKEDCIVSPSYRIFKSKDENILNSEYLMMWFRRPEFDRYARFRSHGSAHEFFDYDEMCEVTLPIPSIEKQQQIVDEYNIVTNRIQLNDKINTNLEATAQALYKHWFVDFEFPVLNKDGSLSGAEGYKSSGGKMVYNEELDKEIPVGWSVERLKDVSKITMGQSPSGGSYNDLGNGKIFYQGRTDFGFRIPTIRSYTSEPKRLAKKGDILMSVRAPVGDLNIANTDCCIGRGLASIRSNEISYTFYLMKDYKKLFDSNKGTGTIFSSINKDELFDLKVIYNKIIANLFEIKINKIDTMIFDNCNQTKTLQEVQSLLLAKMTIVEV